MGLDINTERGQVSLKQEEHMIKYIEKCWGVDFCTTDKKIEAPLDGILIKNKKIIGVCENKCRNMTYDKLLEYGSWLITYEKLEVGKMASILFNVPFLGFLYLVDDDVTLFWKITDENGTFLFEFDKRETKTQANINGGEALRLNAYLPVQYSQKVIQLNTRP